MSEENMISELSDDEMSEIRSRSMQFNQRVDIPRSGFLYTYNHSNFISEEIGAAYSLRQNNRGVNPYSRRGLSLDSILGIFDMLSGVLDMTDSVLSIPNSIPQRVKHRITFKNDADIILVPAQVNVPNRYNYNSVPRIMLPGDVCVFTENHLPNNNSTERLSFSFGAISTDENILPPSTPKNMAAVFPFEVFIGRNANLVSLDRVHGFVSMEHPVFEIRANTLLANSLEMNYVGFRGLRETTMPSFGIAVVRTTLATAAGATMGTQVTFTPLNLRA